MRAHDWPERLVEYIDSRANMPFAWGPNDCCTFAAGAVAAMTGEDHRLAFGHKTEIGAARSLKKHGGIVGICDARLERASIGTAQRGDLGLALIDSRETLVVIEGAEVVAPGARGLIRMPREVLITAWAV
jgi:hypothetical protein